MSIPFLVGERLYLRALHAADAQGDYPSWFNDEEVCQGNSHHVFPYTVDAALTYIQRTVQARDELVLAIVLNDGHKHVGNVALQSIHPVYRSAEFAILIGDKTAWGKGYGREAGRLICDHGFGTLNLNRIACGTFDDNTSMKRLALYLGMSEEGRRRQAAYKRGRCVDIVEYGVLKVEYQMHFQIDWEGQENCFR